VKLDKKYKGKYLQPARLESEWKDSKRINKRVIEPLTFDCAIIGVREKSGMVEVELEDGTTKLVKHNRLTDVFEVVDDSS